MVRMKGQDHRQPLKSLGDGVVRIFQTALALEYARRTTVDSQLRLMGDAIRANGRLTDMLLIDEVESGIHYTAIPEYWGLLFRMARERGVQIVATTHSWDCIEGLQVAAKNDPSADVQLIRLEEDEQETSAIVIDKDDLAIVTRDEIEVR
ncbi:MAG TPA: AAA family ATPase [Pirellulales bacterium]|nr:AAA family ATPase [Pirellulales bacterium]